jgi:predicted PurR-regulated permease PerM
VGRFTNNRIFVGLVYVILGLLVLYLLILIKPMLMNVYVFLRTVFAPFAIALIISYILNPIVTMLAERKMPRSVAVLLIYAVFCAAVTVVLMNVIPMLINQVEELNKHAPELTMRAQNLYDHVNNNSLLPESIRTGITNALLRLEKRLSESVGSFLNNIGAVLNAVLVAFIIPFLAFYIVKDFEVFERTALRYVPRTHRVSVVRLIKDIDAALGSYIRGQVIVCLLIGLLAYAGYWMIGLPYPLLLAAVVAIFNIIPYLGPYFGATPALVIASTISLKMMLFVILVNTVCQIVEGNIISPQIVGRTLHMHPLLIIFAVLVGGELAGIAGMILAVPFFAAGKVVLQHLFAYYIRRKTN